MTTPKGEHGKLKTGLYHPVGKRWSSWVWKHFCLMDNPSDEYKEKAKCVHCPNKWLSNDGTSAMSTHLKQQHHIFPTAPPMHDGGSLLKHMRLASIGDQQKFEKVLHIMAF